MCVCVCVSSSSDASQSLSLFVCHSVPIKQSNALLTFISLPEDTIAVSSPEYLNRFRSGIL